MSVNTIIAVMLLLTLLELSDISPVNSQPLCSTTEMNSLLEFKNSLSIDSSVSTACHRESMHSKTLSWKEGTDCCAWDGVSCDNSTGYVIGLDVSCSWLRGPLGSNSSLFHNLHHLQSLNLSFNCFGSPIVPEFANLANTLTHLDLSYSCFPGYVPLELARLSKLRFLDLSAEYASDSTIDAQTLKSLAQNFTKLQVLGLSGVGMPNVMVEHSLTNLSSSLTALTLVSCQLSGKLPTNILALPNLKVLDLSFNNDLRGHLPLSNWSNPLEDLSLSRTLFSGVLPASIGGLNFLRRLSLFYCNFTGPLPSSLGYLKDIITLDLGMNSFEGEIPTSFSNLNRLEMLDLSYNKLKGRLPKFFTSQELYRADLSNNQLTGPIPPNPEGHQLPSLRYLILSMNSFSGTIPSWVFSSTPLLNVLQLGSNKLEGSIKEFKSTELTSIDLSANNLEGPIPKSVGQLTNLIVLNLSSNDFTVELPLFFKLQQLGSLDLSYNSVSVEEPNSAGDTNSTGWNNMWNLLLSNCNLTKFPSFLRNSSSLQVLDLSGNKIQGQIPEWVANLSLGFLQLSNNSLELPLVFPKTLSFLSISNNKLTGQIPLSICNLKWLRILDLSGNNLSGEIPHCLGNLSNYLLVLDLQMNNLHAAIPGSFSNAYSLRSLHLNGNQLEGPLPRSLGNCTALEVLDLGNNNINDTFPYWLSTLPRLQVLILRCNKFHGSIMESPFPLQLRILDLSFNGFSGNLPPVLFNSLKAMMNADDNSTGLKYIGDHYYLDSVMLNVKGSYLELTRILTIFITIDLSCNAIIGRIPEELGQLVSLKLLNLSHNGLTGTIPSSLSRLKELESLDLSSNNLTGKIPPQLASLNFLSYLNLSYNQLIGLIPQGTQFFTFESNTYLGNPGLCGFPLSRMCSPQELPSECDGQDSDSEFDWEASLVGYLFGIVAGVSLGSVLYSR